MTTIEAEAKRLLTQEPVQTAFKKLASSEPTDYKETAGLDDFLWSSDFSRDHQPVIDYLNQQYAPQNIAFATKEIYGGMMSDLVITDLQKKAAYDAIPKTKTHGQLLAEAEEKYGITSSLTFEIDLNELMTDEEYDRALALFARVAGRHRHKEDKQQDLG